MPGPEVDVIDRAPAQPAPSTMPIAASSSSACTTANVALPSGVTRNFFSKSVVASISEVDGVMGYHATTVTPANTAPMPHAALPSMMILPLVSFIRSMKYGSCLVNVAFAYSNPACTAPKFRSKTFCFLANCLRSTALHHRQVDPQQLRHRAHVHHVLDQLAQLGFGAYRLRDLVERHRVEDHVVAVLLQVQAFFVDGRAAGWQRTACLRAPSPGFSATSTSISRLRAT